MIIPGVSGRDPSMPKRELDGAQESSLGARFDPLTSRPDLIEKMRSQAIAAQLGIMAAKMHVLDPFQVQIAEAGWMNQPRQQTIDYFREETFRATKHLGYDCGKRRSRRAP
jgi:hypothetical protein